MKRRGLGMNLIFQIFIGQKNNYGLNGIIVRFSESELYYYFSFIGVFNK
jgi:hypothetical protein